VTTSSVAAADLRLGARVLLLDPHNRVLLIHARDPDQPDHHRWELPGGGIDPDELAHQAAQRELAEETGITLHQIGPCLWVRDTRFRYRRRDHHRREAAYLGYTHNPAPRLRPKHTPNEKAGLLGHRWWTQPELAATGDKLLPPNLPTLLNLILTGRWQHTIELDN
jgi:8-oxo-dGTP pyrophosphatase MutT (NUDIX family)